MASGLADTGEQASTTGVVVVVVLVSLTNAAIQARAAWSTRGATRRLWCIGAIDGVLYGAVMIYPMLSTPDWMVWTAVRFTGIVVLGGMLTSMPGLAELAPQAKSLLLDGLVVTGSALSLFWVSLTLMGYPAALDRLANPYALVCSPINLLTMSIVLGLVGRLHRDRQQAVIGAAAVTFASGSDILLARTGNLPLSALLVCLCLAIWAVAALHPHRLMVSSRALALVRPQPARWVFLFGIPALFVALLPAGRDLVPTAIAIVVGAALLMRQGVLEQVNIQLLQRVTFRATHDGLTGLLTSGALFAAWGHRAGHRQLAVFDLDDFKRVNDTYGHGVGDTVIRRVAVHLRQLTAASPRQVLVARPSGDEFLAAGSDVDWHRLADDLAQRVAVDPASKGITFSAGVSLPGTSADTALQQARIAMAEAKTAGGGRLLQYDAQMHVRSVATAETRSRIRLAVRHTPTWPQYRTTTPEQLEVDLQPVVRLDDCTIAGAEALVRLRIGEAKYAPDRFMGMLDSTALNLLGEWVLRRSLAWLRFRSGSDRFAVAVNVAAEQVQQDSFCDMVLGALHHAEVRPDRLVLEITEQTAVSDIERAKRSLNPLREAGIHISLDDFGTGFSSMDHLMNLPVDSVKVDRSFVAGIGHDSRREATVRTVLSIGRDLGLEVVCEGVETQRQAEHLMAWGAVYAQGFLFSPPIPEDSWAEQSPQVLRTLQTVSAPGPPSTTAQPHQPAVDGRGPHRP